MLHYLKFMVVLFLFIPVFYLGLFLGGPWMWLGIAWSTVLVILGDLLLGEDLSEPEYKHPWILKGFLFLSLPVVAGFMILLAWISGAARGADWMGIAFAIKEFTGFDMVRAHANNTYLDYGGAVFSVGLIVAGYGTNVAHELCHRTNSRFFLMAGRWLLAPSCNVDFSIEHVYGHHKHVATSVDPATAVRGQNVYSFFVTSTILGHLSAWKIEIKHLRKKGYSILSLRNSILRGYAMSLFLAALFFSAGGFLGLALFLGQAMFAKFILEVVNYMEHYGLVRVPGQPVKLRHSWNTNKKTSSYLLFSLTRHSAHHERSQKEYWSLNAYPEAPVMPFGYMTCIYLCLLPPLWHRIMIPALRDWDARFAIEEEKALAQIQNQNSGFASLFSSAP